MKARRMNAVVVALAATLAMLLSPLAAAKDEDPLAKQAEQALWWGDFDALEDLYLAAAQSKAVDPYSGRTARQSVRHGIGKTLGYDTLNDAYFREFELLAARWARERPGSVLAQLLYSRVLHARAWHIRGEGYWSGVPPRAKEEFMRLIAKSEAHIAERSSLLMSDTATHTQLMISSRSSGWSQRQQLALLEDALSKSTDDEDSLYEQISTSLTPKWGGSLRDLQAFIDDAGQRTQPRRGQEVYALLWTRVVRDVDGNLFSATQARWPSIKQGLESLASKRTDPAYANRLAYFACQAEDRDTAQQWMARLGNEPALTHWRGGGTAGRQNYEDCQRWLQTRP